MERPRRAIRLRITVGCNVNAAHAMRCDSRYEPPQRVRIQKFLAMIEPKRFNRLAACKELREVCRVLRDPHVADRAKSAIIPHERTQVLPVAARFHGERQLREMASERAHTAAIHARCVPPRMVFLEDENVLVFAREEQRRRAALDAAP